MLLRVVAFVQQPVEHPAPHRAQPVHAAAATEAKRPRRPHLDAHLGAQRSLELSHSTGGRSGRT